MAKLDTLHLPQIRHYPLSVGVAAILLGAIYAGSTLPTPLYPLYRHEFGFSQITLTVIYAGYLAGNLTALFVFGRLSDQLGRKRMSMAALGAATVSTVSYLVASSAAWLFAARAVSGLAVAVGAATVTAWLTELYHKGDKTAASTLAACSNMLGLAVAPLVSGALAVLTSGPLEISYAAYLVLLVLLAMLVARSPETVTHTVASVREVSVAPRLSLPREIRSEFVPPAATAFATFALAGFYAALIPQLLAEDLHEPSPAVCGAIVAEIFAAAGIGVLATQSWSSRPVMRTALGLLPLGLAALIAAQTMRSLPWIIVASAVSGLAIAMGFRGSLQRVNEIAPEPKRAEVLSAYLLACYTGNSLPVVGIAVLAKNSSRIVANATFAGVVTALAVTALIIESRARTRTREFNSRPSSSQTGA